MFVAIPALHQGQMYLYNPLIYVTTDEAMAAGREIGGWPKKIADIRIDRVGNEYPVSLARGGERLISATATRGGKLFSTPLPADKAVTLSYPYNMTFPLPPPTSKPQPTIPLLTATFKVIPGCGNDNPPPALAQLIGANWQVNGTAYGVSGRRLPSTPSPTGTPSISCRS
jgi:hypothetical protein